MPHITPLKLPPCWHKTHLQSFCMPVTGSSKAPLGIISPFRKHRTSTPILSLSLNDPQVVCLRTVLLHCQPYYTRFPHKIQENKNDLATVLRKQRAHRAEAATAVAPASNYHFICPHPSTLSHPPPRRPSPTLAGHNTSFHCLPTTPAERYAKCGHHTPPRVLELTHPML